MFIMNFNKTDLLFILGGRGGDNNSKQLPTLCMNVYVYMYVCKHVFIHVCMYVCMYVCEYMHVYVCVYVVLLLLMYV